MHVRVAVIDNGIGQVRQLNDLGDIQMKNRAGDILVIT
jgi:hypothetical protein